MAITPEVLHSYLKQDLLSQGLPYETVFWPDMTLKEAYSVSLVQSLTKKLVTAKATDADDKALRKFLASNQACGEWELASDKLTSKSETILGEVKRVIDQFWFKDGYSLVDHPFDILAEAKLGPGANRLAGGGDFYTKLFSSKLSCSNLSLYNWYKRYTQRFAEWSNAESVRELNFGGPSVASSKLSFVPKNDEISRCICIEPTLNTYFQLGLGRILEQRLKDRFGIDLSDPNSRYGSSYDRFDIDLSEQQFRNRDLARLGSITDSLSTIDLSSASDSISMKMLRYLLPADFYSQLIKYRTPEVEVDGVGTVSMNMISTMGNGFTFPLQTLVFSCVVIACMRFRGLGLDRSTSESSWGVYGDDIICPRSVTADVIATLNLLGFKVNDDKTFTEGPFRESCGSDFFMGSDIRGVYIKKLQDHASFYSAINLLVRFSVKSGIHLWRLVRFLLSKVPRLYVPRWEDLSAGLHAPLILEDVRKLSRCRDLGPGSKRYEAMVPVARYVNIHEETIRVPGRSKKRIYNPSGLLISFLQGSINASRIAVRLDDVRWKRKRRVTSRWDDESRRQDGSPASTRDHFDYGVDWPRWEIVAHGLFN